VTRMVCRFALALLIVAGAVTESLAIEFNTFDQAKGIELAGSATFYKNALRLTPAKHSQTGAAWLTEKQPVSSHFETTFQFQFTHFCRFGGADGLAFVMQSAGPDAIGGRGSAGGFGVASRMYRDHSGIPWSFAIFFDTWKNSDEGDSSDNHIAIRSNGRSSAMRWPADRLAFTPTLPVHLKDGRVHTARIVYERPVIQVYIDTFDSAVLATTLDLAPVADSEGKAWIGFTASTGWGCENHDVLRWSFQSEKVSSDTTVVSSEVGYPMSACLPEHNLCTPEKSFIKRVGDTYHLVLPGNAIWGVRNPIR
jgi:hypothetical protein